MAQHINSFNASSESGFLMFSRKPTEKASPLEGFPQCSVGAPCPALIATEHSLILIFYLQEADPAWDGTSVRIVGVESEGEPAAIVTFKRSSIHTFGPPNDEAFSGHRLSSKGVHPYGAFEVFNSEWLDQLERMNAVHPRHERARFMEGKRHFIITFHDSTFECIAEGYKIESRRSSIKQLLQVYCGSINA